MFSKSAVAFSAGMILALASLPQAAAVVTVFGGGLGRDCYEAVKHERVGFTEARATCDLAIREERMTPRDRAATYINRGILFMREKHYDRAISDYERAIQLKPALLEAHVNRGAALYSLGRYDEALAALDKGIETENLEARAIGHYNRGLVKERFGDVTAAYYDFKTALDLHPEFEQAARQLSRFQVQVVPGS